MAGRDKEDGSISPSRCGSDDGRPKINGTPFDSKSLEMIAAAQMAEQQKQICRLFLWRLAVIGGHL
jgi:hypothetical protein